MPYALALLGCVAAVTLRYVLDPILGDQIPFVTTLGATALAVWLSGYAAAAVAAVIGYAACSYLFVPPRGTLIPADRAHAIALVAYFFTSALIILLGEAMRRAQRRAAQRAEVFRVTLASIGDAVITTDLDGRVSYLNSVAEALTGWRADEAAGRPLETVLPIVNEETRAPVDNPAMRALREGVVVGLANHTVLIRKDGSECPIDDSAAPILDDEGRVSGCVLIFRDVRAQRSMEQEKAAQLLTARRLASIIECSDDAIIGKSLDGTIQSWNAGAQRLFGHPAEHAVGRHISLIIPPERLSEEDAIIASLKAGKRVDHYETERMRADGTRIFVSLTISPIKDASGAVVGASKIARDVTRQRVAEERERQLQAEAAALNAKFHAFFDQGAVFAGIMDLDGTIIEPNRLSWEGCGFARDQIVGKPFWQGPWWTPRADLVAKIRSACAEAAAGRTFREELPYFLGDGSERFADVTIQPIRDEVGRVLFLAPTGTDITDRKRAEADREKFVALIENSTDFIGMCDLDGVPFFVNRAGLALVGLDDIDEARRTDVSSFFFEEDRDRVMHEFFPNVLAQGHSEMQVRFRNFKTGEARWMAYKVLALSDGKGGVAAFGTVSQDVTEQKRLEQDLRSLAADLSEADRRKNEFLALLAHELRNPLAPISNATQALRKAPGDQATVRCAVDMLDRQVSQMSRLVDDLLDVSRISRGKIELRKQRTELGPIIEHAVESVLARYRSRNHVLTTTMPQHPVVLHADPARLAQVVENLLNNACKFTDAGGRISLTVEPDHTSAVIRVRDNGIGIEAKHVPSLFDMFAQVDTSLERSRDGLGIGLPLVKTLVEMHGGSVRVHSEGLGRGAEFTVSLPLSGPSSEPASDAAKSESAPLARRRILVVDDNQDGAESLAMMLELHGHEAHKAFDGEQALDVARHFRPNIVLLDIGLPKMNGYEVCRRLREEPWGKTLIIVALTGWGQEEDRRRSKEAGFDTHLVKPVDLKALTRVVGAVRNAPNCAKS